MDNETMPRPRVCSGCLQFPCACPDMSEDSPEHEADDWSQGVSWGQFVDAIQDSKRIMAELEIIAAEWRAEVSR